MNRLVGLITPVWLALGAFLFGLGSGGAGAWYLQGLRLAAVKAEYAGFVATSKAEGEAAKKLADAQAAEDKRKKESSDHEYQMRIASLAADNQRLRDARARSGYVPAAPAGSRSPGLACFDRADLESALRRLDAGISGLVGEGDADAVGLNVARSWAGGIRPDTSRGSPAKAVP